MPRKEASLWWMERSIPSARLVEDSDLLHVSFLLITTRRRRRLHALKEDNVVRDPQARAELAARLTPWRCYRTLEDFAAVAALVARSEAELIVARLLPCTIRSSEGVPMVKEIFATFVVATPAGGVDTACSESRSAE